MTTPNSKGDLFYLTKSRYWYSKSRYDPIDSIAGGQLSHRTCFDILKLQRPLKSYPDGLSPRRRDDSFMLNFLVAQPQTTKPFVLVDSMRLNIPLIGTSF
jgi:hypothetical protein